MTQNLDWPGVLLMSLAFLGVALILINQGRGSPNLSILNRWVFWSLFSLGSAYLIQDWGWSSRPFWANAMLALLTWLLIETIYNWLAINALNRANLPLFPTYQAQAAGGEWPNMRRFLKVRQWLRDEGFQRRQALLVDVHQLAQLRSTVYEEAEAKVRIQVLFIPRARSLSVCYILSSCLVDGSRLQTDNLFLPFGGYYPNNWRVTRRPLVRSLPALLRVHRRHLKRLKPEPIPFEQDPVDDLNDQQGTLEKHNVDLGFLNPRYARPERGPITSRGRYRIWVEIWLLSYLGQSLTR